jgi:plastocyanin
MTKSAIAALWLLPAALFASGATITGTVTVQGHIEKVQAPAKKYSPYSSGYDSPDENTYEDTPAAVVPQQMVVYVQGLPPAKATDPPPVLSQKNRNFTASILPVQPGEPVEIRNDDTVRHHIRSKAEPWAFNLKPRAPGETVTRTFEAPPGGGVGVIPVYCDIHSNMRAHILVMPSPKWQLLPETGGAFKLAGLPPGTYTLTAWHPTLKPQPVTFTIKKGQKRKKLHLVMLGRRD